MNNVSLKYYDEHAKEFVSETITADMSEIYLPFLSLVKNRGMILDLGCGSGRDSKYFVEKEFQVVAIDGSENICKLASQYLGQKVICKKIEDVDYVDVFDGIWACASLLHVSKCEMQMVLHKLIVALKNQGILYASFKYGTKEYRKDGRLFSDYTEQELENIFSTMSGVKMEKIFLTKDVRKDRKNEMWVNVLIRKA